MAEAFTDDRIQIFQDWIDGKLHHYPLGHDADKDARIIVGGFLATITTDRKRIEELEKRPEEIYEGELEAARKHLCEAAEEINCAGRIPHRIRILKKELGQKLADQTAVIERLREALTKIAAYGDKTAEAHFWKEGNYAAFDEPSSVQTARQALDAGKE